MGKLNNFEKQVEFLLVKNKMLDSLILQEENMLKRDITIDEEYAIIKDFANDTQQRMAECSMSLTDAFYDVIF